LGRAFLTWFNPGSGTGYAFTVSNMATLAITAIAMGLYAQLMAFDGQPNDERWFIFAVMAVAYVAAYLGVGRLIVVFVRRYVWGGLAMAFVIQLFIAAMGAILPFLVQLTTLGAALADEYTLIQAPNWAWTMYAIADDSLTGVDLAVYAIVPGVAFVVFLMNMALAAREIAAERIQTPERVIEDELQLHPEKAPKPAGPQNPWDYDPAAEPAPS
jgi:hypothetical protein